MMEDRSRKVPVHDKRRTVAAAPEVEGEPEVAVDEAPVEPEPYVEDLKRLQAEFDNYRKRMIKEQSALAERASARLLERLLPVLDDFERAIAHGDGGDGVRLVFKHLKEALEQEGLEEVVAEDQPFDPERHEAVDYVEDPSVTDTVCKAVYRRGYKLGDKLLRPAMVVVARPPEGEPAGDEKVGTVTSEPEPGA